MLTSLIVPLLQVLELLQLHLQVVVAVLEAMEEVI
jgi:hypothetical protein